MAVGHLVELDVDNDMSATTTATVTVPNDGSVVVGDLLLWAFTYASSSRTNSVSGIAGYTALDIENSQAGHSSQVWYKVAESGDLGSNITVTMSSTGVRNILVLGKISGVDTLNPLDFPAKWASIHSTSSTVKTPPTVTSVAAGSREVHLVFDTRGTPDQTTNWTAPSGITRQGQNFLPGTNQLVSMAWGDSDAEVSSTIGGSNWTAAPSAAMGSAWTLGIKSSGTTYEDDFDDDLGLTDSTSLTQGHTVTLTDTEGLTDTLSFAQNTSDELEDPEGLTDALSLSGSLTETYADALGLTDSLDLSLVSLIEASVSDSLGLTDSLDLVLTEPPPVVLPNLSTQLVMGPATVYIGAYGATEPSGVDLWNTPDPEVWIPVGGTQNGMEMVVEQEYKTIELMQIPDNPLRRLIRRNLTAKTSLAEPTLQNLLYVLNSGEITEGTGYREYSAPVEIDEATPLDYRAILIFGWSPGYNKRRLVILRKCLNVDSTSFQYSRDGQTVLNASWSVHHVDSSTAPFRIVDEA